MILAYYRLGKFDDAQRSMRQLLNFARRFRMDNPLVQFGADVYQPGLPINLTYDAFGPPAAFVRGLFEYLYHADRLTLVPHVPPTITRLEQRFPVRFGSKHLYVATVGAGPISRVTVNGKTWDSFDGTSVTLHYDQLPQTATIEIALGDAQPRGFHAPPLDSLPQAVPSHETTSLTPSLLQTAERLTRFHRLLSESELGETYEAAHARLAVDFVGTAHDRLTMLRDKKLEPLTNPESQAAANQSYVDTASKLADGLIHLLDTYSTSTDPQRQQIVRLWEQSAGKPN